MFYLPYNVLFAVQCFISHWVGVMYRCTDNLCLKCPEKNKTKRQKQAEEEGECYCRRRKRGKRRRKTRKRRSRELLDVRNKKT